MFLSVTSNASEGTQLQSVMIYIGQIIEPIDSIKSQTSCNKLQWKVGLGITKNGPMGFLASTSLSYPVTKNLGLQASSGLVAFRGPTFEYGNEHYFNDGGGYGYFVNEYLIGNYLGHQFSVGAVLAEPFIERFSLSLSMYHLRLLRSSYVNRTESIRSSGESRSYSYGVNEDEKGLISPSGFNYGFSGINRNDFGLKIGVGYQGKRLGFGASINLGLTDWGDNDYFGDTKESATFSNVQLTYLLKK